jgi:hypothetical protein
MVHLESLGLSAELIPVITRQLLRHRCVAGTYILKAASTADANEIRWKEMSIQSPLSGRKHRIKSREMLAHAGIDIYGCG